jgi:hypothetical protein
MVVGLIFTGTSTETLELGLFIGGRVFFMDVFLAQQQSALDAINRRPQKEGRKKEGKV